MKKYLLLLLVLVACANPRIKTSAPAPAVVSVAKNSLQSMKAPYVLLVSIDGYRYDYTKKFAPPNLSKIKAQGFSVESLIPSFPSKTFPNHFTIVTGLYPEHHGIVANQFFDFARPEGKKEYRLNLNEAVTDGSWYGGVPLWVLAEKNNMRSATYFWPGSEAEIQGFRPSATVKYDTKVPNLDRIQKVIEWLKQPEDIRPHFVTLYFSDVDSVGHEFGTESQELKNAVMKVDSEIGVLQARLSALSFPVNLMIVSDHGMENLDPKKMIHLDELSDLSNVTVAESGPQMFIYDPKKLALDKIYSDLKKHGNHFKVYKREKLPKHFHFDENQRVGDLVVIADMPYSLVTKKLDRGIPFATHGYDPEKYKSMQAIFYAIGPNVKPGHAKATHNINLYPWIAKKLGLRITDKIDGKVFTQH